MGLNLNEFMTHHKQTINVEIEAKLEELSIPVQLKDSMLYSFHAGGKRIRPLLLMASFLEYQDDPEKSYSSAIALEMIHTYSLIHDDLPAMDDDDLRRGQATNHKKFDEATAILAGDALLTYSFEVILNDPLLTDNEKVVIAKLLSESSGPKGMVAGQILDMEAEKNPVDLKGLEQIHDLKTGQLLRFAIVVGAYLGGASKNDIAYLKEYAYYLGLIFQVQDDILDVIGNVDQLGKPVGSDEGNEKSTYPKLMGLDKAKKQRDHYVEKATKALDNIDREHIYLLDMLHYLTARSS